MITVFTATYNRKSQLQELYRSLQKQSYKDFEWIIVDDGSQDNTREVVEEFKKNNDMKILYKYKENGGKMSAYNMGVELANGDIFLCIDSDDLAVEDSLKIVAEKYDEIKDNGELAGLAFLDVDRKTKEVIGTKFPQDGLVDTYYNIYNLYKVKGDKSFIFKTNILKNYSFPQLGKEKFVPEAWLFNKICEKYKIKCYNIPVIDVEYLEEGYSKNYFKLAKNNPLGQVLYYKELYALEPTLYNVAAYDMYSIFAKEGFMKTIKKHPNKLKAIAMYLPALYKAITKR